MKDTFTQIIIQIVFAVKNRERTIKECYREELQKYMCGVIRNKNCKPLAIYCNPDHTHILIGLHPSIALSDLVRDIKSNSGKWLNTKMKTCFRWQKGYSAFSYNRKELELITKYIRNQPIHHKKSSFQEEYQSLMESFEI